MTSKIIYHLELYRLDRLFNPYDETTYKLRFREYINVYFSYVAHLGKDRGSSKVLHKVKEKHGNMALQQNT